MKSEILYELEAMAYKGLEPAWRVASREVATVMVRREENKPVLWRAHAILHEKMRTAEERVLREFFSSKQEGTIAEAYERDVEMRGLLEERSRMQSTPPEPVPMSTMTPCVIQHWTIFMSANVRSTC